MPTNIRLAQFLRRLLLLCGALLVSSGVAASARVLVLGDSLSASYGLMAPEQGWVHLLQQSLAERQVEVVNASVSGDTTAGGLARLPRLLQEYRPDLVLIELGGNDGLRGYSLADMKRQLRQLVAQSRRTGAQVLLLEMQIPPNYGRRYTEKFAGVFSEVAREESVPLVPFFLREVALREGLMLPDGIHPSAAAQPSLRDAVLPYVLEQLGAGSAQATGDK